MYAIAKHIHLTAIAVSVVLFLLRFIWTLSESQMLQKKWVKILPHITDTLLLLSAATLCVMLQQYPFATAWVSEKLLGLVMYVFMVVLTLKIAKTGFMRFVGLIGALSWVAFSGFVAVTKQALIF
ncbi:MAG: putative membrane protein SirB2 [Paraglaciecola sp.]|jgi:uncharacterized membrane protein SirB2